MRGAWGVRGRGRVVAEIGRVSLGYVVRYVSRERHPLYISCVCVCVCECVCRPARLSETENVV